MPAAARLCAALLILGAHAAGAQELRIVDVAQRTDNRGWNEAGVGPLHQVVVEATVEPSGFPTLVFAEQGGERQPMVHWRTAATPHLYVLWLRFDAAKAGPWRIVAERGEARAVAEVPANALARKVALAERVRVAGAGTQPQVRWALPGRAGAIDRIRVAVRGGERVHGRFLDVIHVSPALPPDAKALRIPAGVLQRGERYIFEVMLEQLDAGRVANRSEAFSAPYTVPRN